MKYTTDALVAALRDDYARLVAAYWDCPANRPDLARKKRLLAESAHDILDGHPLEDLPDGRDLTDWVQEALSNDYDAAFYGDVERVEGAREEEFRV